jgi:hypothetical protein
LGREMDYTSLNLRYGTAVSIGAQGLEPKNVFDIQRRSFRPGGSGSAARDREH